MLNRNEHKLKEKCVSLCSVDGTDGLANLEGVTGHMIRQWGQRVRVVFLEGRVVWGKGHGSIMRGSSS